MHCTAWIYFSSEHTVFHIPDLNCALVVISDTWSVFYSRCSGIVHRSAIDIMPQNDTGVLNFTGDNQEGRESRCKNASTFLTYKKEYNKQAL